MTAYLRPFAELIAVALFMGGLMLASISIDEIRRVQVRPAEMVVRSAHLEAGR